MKWLVLVLVASVCWAGGFDTRSQQNIIPFKFTVVGTGKCTTNVTLPDILGGVSRINVNIYLRRVRGDTSVNVYDSVDSTDIWGWMRYGAAFAGQYYLTDSVNILRTNTVTYTKAMSDGNSVRVPLAKIFYDSSKFDRFVVGFDTVVAFRDTFPTQDLHTSVARKTNHYQYRLPLVQALQFIWTGGSNNRKKAAGSIISGIIVVTPGDTETPGMPFYFKEPKQQ